MPSKLALFRNFDANTADLSHTDDIACTQSGTPTIERTPSVANIATGPRHAHSRLTQCHSHVSPHKHLKTHTYTTNTQQAHLRVLYTHTHTHPQSTHPRMLSQTESADMRRHRSQSHTMVHNQGS